MIQMIQNESLYFSNPECWDDPLESYVLDRQYVNNIGKCDYPIKDRIGICCFTQTAANEAQWKVYNNPQNDVIVQVTFDYAKLKTIITRALHNIPEIVNNEIYCDEVEYISRTHFYERSKKILSNKRFLIAFNEVSKGINTQIIELLRPFTLKSSAYFYENEMRFVLVFNDYLCKKGYELKLPGLRNTITKISISSKNEKNNQLSKIKADIINKVQGLGINVCINSIFHRPMKRQDINIK